MELNKTVKELKWQVFALPLISIVAGCISMFIEMLHGELIQLLGISNSLKETVLDRGESFDELSNAIVFLVEKTQSNSVTLLYANYVFMLISIVLILATLMNKRTPIYMKVVTAAAVLWLSIFSWLLDSVS